jgi:two-component system, OmpR family, response regulator VanR
MTAHFNILIVEDSPTQTKFLRLILEENDFIVDSALDGARALECIRLKKPDLVITDIVMPEMDGFALCKALKSDPALKSIPVMMLTSLTDPEDVIKGLQAGADNFLTKPYEDHFLISCIHYIFANQELRRNWGSTGSEVEIMFAGQQYSIDSDRMQIIDLLLSTYENAVQKNSELKKTHNDLIRTYLQLEQKNMELEQLTQDLQEARVEIRTLTGLLPICAHCKKIRDDHGSWHQIETYRAQRSDVKIAHIVCPSCSNKLLPGDAQKL